MIFFLKVIVYFFQGRVSFRGIPFWNPRCTLVLKRSSVLVIGSSFRVRSFSSIRLAESSKIIVGDHFFSNRGLSLNAHNLITIGNNVQFGESVLIYDHDHNFSKARGIMDGYKIGTVRIGNNCWLGSNVVVLRDTHIGDGCIIGAGVILSGNIPSGSVVVGPRHYSVKSLT